MDITTLSDWLKNSIPGIVVLGAVGSILAACLIWLVMRLVPRVARKVRDRLIHVLVKHFVKASVAQAVRLHFLNTPNKAQLFYTLQAMKFASALFVALCAFASFIFAVATYTESLVRVGVLAPLVVFFLGVWYALRCLAIVAVPLFHDVETPIEEAKKELLSNRAK